MKEDRVFVTGMPRADIFFEKQRQQEALQLFYKEYPQCKNKKIILYAPTFRDSQVANPVVELDYKNLAETLGEEYIVGLRLHPFVAKNRSTESSLPKQVIDFSGYTSLNTLLFATEILISDYSSIIFEFAALQRPMLFYAYDLSEFQLEGRGFYWDYKKYVPGPVAENEEELKAALLEILDGRDIVNEYHREEFLDDTYAYKDSHSAKRIYELLHM